MRPGLAGILKEKGGRKDGRKEGRNEERKEGTKEGKPYFRWHTWVSSPLPDVDPVYGLEMLSRLMTGDGGVVVVVLVLISVRMVAVAPMWDVKRG
jgi:hypothetical protein